MIYTFVCQKCGREQKWKYDPRARISKSCCGSASNLKVVEGEDHLGVKHKINS